MTRQEKIKILKDVCAGRGGEAMRKLKEQWQQKRISFLLSEISTPLLYLIVHCRQPDNKNDAATAFVDAFFKNALQLSNDEAVKDFVATFEKEHRDQIANYLQEYELKQSRVTTFKM